MKTISALITLIGLWAGSLYAQDLPVTFMSGSLLLEGTLSVPEGDGPFPVVVFAHGSGPTDRDGTLPLVGGNFNCLYPGLVGDTVRLLRDLSDALVAHGIAVLRYDKRSLTHAATLDPQTITPYDFIDDLHAAVDFAKTQPEINSECIILAGHSQGSSFIPIVARERDDISLLVSLAGAATSIDTLLADQILYIGTTCGDSASASTQAAQTLAALTQIRNNTWPSNVPLLGAYPLFWKDWIDISDSAISNYQQAGLPTLFLQGDEDINVPFTDAVRFEQQVTHDGVEVVIFDGINHYLSTTSQAQVAQPLIDSLLLWLDEQKSPPTSVTDRAPNDPALYHLTQLDDQLVVEAKAGGTLEHCSVVDLLGRPQHDASINGSSYRLDVDAFSPGIYVVSLRIDGQFLQQKVFIR